LSKYHNIIQLIGKAIWSFVRFIIIFGLAYLILKPFIGKVLLAFMKPDDLLDTSVRMIPRHFSSYYWDVARKGIDIASTGLISTVIALSGAFISMFFCSMIGYGLARFQFRGNRIVFILVIVIMLIPQQVYSVAQYLGFRNFLGSPFNMIDTVFPLYLLNFSGLGLKEGLYIYILMTFFRGLPKDLENAAAIDGAGPLRTFMTVMLPNARNMMATVFLFSFSWQWTDTSYSRLFFPNLPVMAVQIQKINIKVGLFNDALGTNIARNAACILLLIPLIILFLIFQRMLIKSIVHSGQAN
jgi:multiple sugar transport system permease protein